MIIQIDETNTVNKGAELMFTAVIEQLEQNYSERVDKVIFNSALEHPSINTSFKIVNNEKLEYKIGKFINMFVGKFKLPFYYFTIKHPVSKDVNVVLDAGGFQFSDQWRRTDWQVKMYRSYYSKLKKRGVKIVFLPQALGPFKTENGIKVAKIINEFSDLVIAREQTSFDNIEAFITDKSKLKCFPDFTLKVKGTLVEKYSHLKNKVCIIPNNKMLTHTEVTKAQYLNFYKTIITKLQEHNIDVFLLNHEGEKDYNLCKLIKQSISNDVTIVTNLNAKEVKGVISQSYFTISSRFHGVASALSTLQPCLATSWSHKYELLFNDFGLTDMILNVTDTQDQIDAKIEYTLNNYDAIVETITTHKSKLLLQIDTMWDTVENVITS